MEQTEVEPTSPPVSRPTFTWAGVLEGARQMLPVAVSIFLYGLTFGVLAGQAGLSLLESLLMSMLVFAGSAQFAALGLWAAPLPTAAIIGTTLVVNLRHLLMGAALKPHFQDLKGWQKYLSLFFLSDESWALTMGHYSRGGHNGAFLLGAGLASIPAWPGSTLVGHLLGSVLADPADWGLDFAFTAVFLGLLVGFWQGKRDLAPWAVSAAVAVLAALYLPGKWYILLGGLAGSLVGGLRNDS
jgi:4-azaleucine resistance transporter AzlC